MKAVVIGCGLIGQKRAANLAGLELIGACDKVLAKAEALAAQHPGCKAFSDYKEALALPADIAIICTTHNLLAPIALEAVKSGKHVLVEKPGARTRAELEPLALAAKAAKKTVKVGFNHRFHPAFLKAQQILEKGKAGPLMFIRARYGHGGRVGYEKEWRAQKEISGGGELVDQGMHLIDLSRLFLGDFSEAGGVTPTYFWDMKVDDNAFMQLRTPKGQIAWLHASWTEWKNMFSFEIYARDAKLQIEGLGGSYGVETLTHYQMKPEMGPPEAKVYEFPGPDQSWDIEMKEFLTALKLGVRPGGDIEDALAALGIVDAIYQSQGIS